MSKNNIYPIKPVFAQAKTEEPEADIQSYMALWQKLLIESFYDACSNFHEKVLQAFQWVESSAFEAVLQLAGLSVKVEEARKNFAAAVEAERKRQGLTPIGLNQAT